MQRSSQSFLPFSQPTKLKSIHLGTVPSIVKNNVRAIGINTDVYGPARYVPQAITKAFDLVMLFKALDM